MSQTTHPAVAVAPRTEPGAGWEPRQVAAVAITLGAFALPSLTAYRILFAACAGAAVVGALIALVIATGQRTEEPAAA